MRFSLAQYDSLMYGSPSWNLPGLGENEALKCSALVFTVNQVDKKVQRRDMPGIRSWGEGLENAYSHKGRRIGLRFLGAFSGDGLGLMEGAGWSCLRSR